MVKKKKEIQNTSPKNQNDLPLDLPPPIKSLLEFIPKDLLPSAIEQAKEQIEVFCYEHYSGIIPPPDALKKYNEIIPDGANRLVKMAEEQSAHRQKQEAKVIKWQIFQSITGQFMAFVIAIFSLTLTYLLANNGHTEVALALATTTIIGLVSVFIFGKKRQKKNLEEKA